ncbi:MAG: type II toxin-antitoxin system RelE/ParE family toxin [Candidatus Nanopelagicales bacterium]
MSDGSPDRLAITATARRQLAEHLPETVAFAAHESISGPLPENPRRVGKQLMRSLDDRHSARRGTYRILYRIDDAEHVVIVLAVAARADAYRTT